MWLQLPAVLILSANLINFLQHGLHHSWPQQNSIGDARSYSLSYTIIQVESWKWFKKPTSPCHVAVREETRQW